MHLFSAGYSKTICGSTKISKESRDENCSCWDMTFRSWPNRFEITIGHRAGVQPYSRNILVLASVSHYVLMKHFLTTGLHSFSWQKSSSELLITFKKRNNSKAPVQSRRNRVWKCKKYACSRQVKRRDTVMLTSYSNVLKSPPFLVKLRYPSTK